MYPLELMQVCVRQKERGTRANRGSRWRNEMPRAEKGSRARRVMRLYDSAAEYINSAASKMRGDSR